MSLVRLALLTASLFRALQTLQNDKLKNKGSLSDISVNTEILFSDKQTFIRISKLFMNFPILEKFAELAFLRLPTSNFKKYSL
jgi:hypothetical protein